MVKYFTFFLRLVFKQIRQLWLKFKAFRKYGIYLPEGSYILKPESIEIGKDFAISPYCQLLCQDPETGSKLVIGDRVALNFNVIINADRGGKIRIGNNVIIGPMVIFRSSNHKFEKLEVPIRDQGSEPGYIIVEDDVWIGAGAVILPNVKIGKSSVVGAGSVVSKDIPPYSIAVGNPAKAIRRRKTVT